jgi:hypothetical protein
MAEINPIQHAPALPKVKKVKPDKDKRPAGRDLQDSEKRTDRKLPRQHIDEYA